MSERAVKSDPIGEIGDVHATKACSFMEHLGSMRRSNARQTHEHGAARRREKEC